MLSKTCTRERVAYGHPCFGGNRHKNGRIHLSVAPRCNIKCGYCERKHDCANESRPGVASRLLTPREGLEQVRAVMADSALCSIIKVIGIAGPGDPLANDETFETFRLVQEEFPDLLYCLSTNGLALPSRIRELAEINLHSLSVTINAVDPDVGAKIYQHVRYRNKVFHGEEAAAILIHNQFEGVRLAAELGAVIKVNAVLIPGVNDGQIPLIVRRARSLGAFIMNVMPVIPQAGFSHVSRPAPEYLEQVRSGNEGIMAQFRGCQQCRADAVGLIGECT